MNNYIVQTFLYTRFLFSFSVKCPERVWAVFFSYTLLSQISGTCSAPNTLSLCVMSKGNAENDDSEGLSTAVMSVGGVL